MPTYQNSAGNTGISRQYDEWRHFNASIKKLGEYRAPRLNLRQQPVMSKNEINWGEAVLEAGKGMLGMFEARREYSYKLADDWLSKHSLEEYHQAMKSGNVPFQDDPLAMQRLKFRHGEVLADIAQRDFQSRIEKGEFIGMEPEEIDAENYKYMQEVLTKDTDVYPYKANGDWFFNQGFWANANKFRSEVFDKSKTVDDKYYKQQALIQTQADIVSLVQGGANAKQLASAMQLAPDAFGYHITPEEWTKIAANVGDQLSLTPWGSQVLGQMKDMKVPTLGNITYKDVWGGEKGVQALKVSSANFRYSNDMILRRSDFNTIEDLVNKGNVEELQRKAIEIRKQDGGDSTRFKEYWGAADRAQTQRDKLIKQRSKQTKESAVDTANLYLADRYLSALLNGDSNIRDYTNERHWDAEGKKLFPQLADERFKLTKENIDYVFEESVRRGRYPPAQIAQMATATYDTYNPAREYIRNNCKNAFSVIQGQVNNVNAVPNFKVEEPENISTLMEIYQADPSAFGDLGSQDTLMMQTMLHAFSGGILDYNQMIRSMAWYANESKDSKDVKTITNRIIKRDITDKLDLISLGDGGAIDNTPLVKSIVQYTAGFYKVMGLNNEQAISKAIEQVNDNYYQIGNNMVPKRFFSNSTLTAKGTELLADKWADSVSKELEARHMDFTGVNIWHNPYSNSIEVCDAGNGNLIMSLSKEELGRLIDKEKENIFIRVKAEDYRRATGGTGVVPETFEGGD